MAERLKESSARRNDARWREPRLRRVSCTQRTIPRRAAMPSIANGPQDTADPANSRPNNESASVVGRAEYTSPATEHFTRDRSTASVGWVSQSANTNSFRISQESIEFVTVALVDPTYYYTDRPVKISWRRKRQAFRRNL